VVERAPRVVDLVPVVLDRELDVGIGEVGDVGSRVHDDAMVQHRLR
jgi:hypothetical protein